MKFMDVLDPLQMSKGGLLWKPIKQATGLTDAQMIGLGAAAAAPFLIPAMGAGAASAAPAVASAAAPTTATAATTAATAPASTGMLGQALAGYTKYGAPALQGASMAQGLLSSHQQGMQAPQLQGGSGGDMSQLIQANNSQLAALQQKRLQRQGLLG